MHTIKFVANQTGLSQHTIRAWERRYAALAPDRTATNRRLYTAEDMEKLSLLHRAVQAGHSIGQIARLTIPELKRLLAGSGTGTASPLKPAVISPTGEVCPTLDDCLRAVERLDADGLAFGLTRAAAMLGSATMLEQVALPLMQRLGDGWRDGTVRPSQEHMATAILRTFMGRTLASFQTAPPAPRLIVTTPVGQLHELGALMAAVTAASEGWRVLYLGPNLPAEEIAGAAHQADARAVALSLAYPPDDSRLPEELISLRTYLGAEPAVLVGGRAAAAYRKALDDIGALLVDDMRGLRGALESIRSGQDLLKTPA